MDPMLQLIHGRSDPGILIFNLKKQITYVNDIAGDILSDYRLEKPAQAARKPFRIPPEINEIIEDLKYKLTHFAWNSCSDAVYLKTVVSIAGGSFAIRGFVISSPIASSSTHFLILLEKIATRHKINPDKAQAHFHLSKRESQLVQLLVRGLTNKEIANRLNLAESTVKDYLHKVMAKVGATTRSGVVSQVLSTSHLGISTPKAG